MSLYNRHVCPIGVGFDLEGNTQVVFCGQWSCPRCRKRLAIRWARDVETHITDNPLPGDQAWKFLTLTLGAKFRHAEDGYQAIPGLWDKTRKQLQRKYGKVSYVAFVEGQEKRSGMPHFHIILSELPPVPVSSKTGRITKRALHDWSNSLGWGFMSDLQELKDGEAFAYVAKYVSKGTPECPKGFRRVRTSQDMRRIASDNEKEYIFPERDERLTEYLLRVEAATGQEVDELYERWSKSWNQVYNYRKLSTKA